MTNRYQPRLELAVRVGNTYRGYDLEAAFSKAINIACVLGVDVELDLGNGSAQWVKPGDTVENLTFHGKRHKAGKPEQPVGSPWTPVGLSLPQEGEAVLAWTTRLSPSYRIAYLNDGAWVDDCSHIAGVTHWAPLPEPVPK
jgi:uncharacterized protein DUF551